MNNKIPGVGPAYARKLEKLGIRTARDLLYHLPSRYEDFSLISKIANLQEGETVTVQGKILEIKNVYTKNGFMLQQAKIQDDTGTLDILWFNQRFLTRVLHKDDYVSLSGKVEKNNHKLQLTAPQYEVIYPGKGAIHTGRLVPVYPETEGISSKWLRGKIHTLLENIREVGKINEYLPKVVLEENGLMPLQEAIIKVHFPDNLKQAEEAKKRLAFDELLLAQVQAKVRRDELQKKQVGNKLEIVGVRKDLTALTARLPFELTAAQKKVVNEIYQDLASARPMNRLLQGDVGSGKTVVAALAMLATTLNGFQAALMAPTEILANQHYETLRKLGMDVGIATGSKKDYQNKGIIVGTHALLSDDLNFKKLGLIVIDEQHRFGVSQRAKLAEKGINPHILTMTATPIPRTIALTLYGDLNLSVLDELPKNRLPVKTWVVPKHKRKAAYEWIKQQKTQAFIVCPLIEESETLQTVKSAKTEYDYLSKNVFPDLKLGLLHGRMKPKEKDKVLEDFRRGKLDILVATPVVEVGIDIPTATIMVIEAADRFGLAQLHQLRGRVGRADRQSYCLLFTENESEYAVKRLKNLEKINNGMELAEIDLRFRGPGQRFGTAQHGRWDLRIADFSDLDLIERTNQLAQKVTLNLENFPLLRQLLEESKINIASN
ncbi:ATP-dependent DNA helicase RecG [Patescibacteria group bacterium]|nr:ATP-dependent DNA helicase RecG [Patescibacteria group bacterium]